MFDALVQYPLPKRDGIRDYVVYLVNQTKGYGKGARAFFDRFYKDHVVLTATSLEGIVTALRSHATTHQVTQIRELTLVAHGAANELYPSVIEGTSDATYKCITEYSLAALQEAIQDGQFQAFRDARRVVCGLLNDDSWVTIRACNVGQSRDILYALYLFFGGKANVYAPTEYMFFAADFPVGPGSRVSTPVEVYTHLRKQHFLKTDEHTPERKGAIVEALLDPGAFADEVELASLAAFDVASTDVVAYEALRTTLNKERVPAVVRTKLAAADHELTAKPLVVVIEKGVRWVIRDRKIDEQGEPLLLEYEVRDTVDGGSKLIARPQIADARSNKPGFPIQLMMSQVEERMFKNTPVILADYADDGTASSADAKATASTMRALLDARQLANAAIDLGAQIESGLSYQVSLDEATVEPTSATSWGLAASEPLRIAWIDYDRDGTTAHSLVVQYALDDAALKARQLEIIRTQCSDPDTPGVELPAYLDRCTQEELMGFIDHLRDPPRVSNAFFIYHAGRAIARKRGFTVPRIDLDNPLGDYLMLRTGENDDLAVTAFPYEFNAKWNDVRASSGRTVVFTSDPFEDTNYLLTHTLRLQGSFVCDGQDPDSPSVDLDDVRAHESRGSRARYFKNRGGKGAWPTAEVREPASCADFAAALAKLKELQAQDYTPEQIRAKLEELTASDGESFLQKLMSIKDGLSFGVSLAGMAFDMGVVSKVFTAADILGLIATDAALGDWILTGILDFAGDWTVAISVPLYLYQHVLDELDAAYKKDNEIGQLTAIRFWFYKLTELDPHDPVPDSPFWDLGSDEAAATAGYRAVYYRDEYGHYWPGHELSLADQFILSPSDLADGYFAGVMLMERVAPEVLARADQYISQLVDALPIDPCKLKHLREMGFVDFDALRATVLRALGWAILEKIPKLPVSW